MSIDTLALSNVTKVSSINTILSKESKEIVSNWNEFLELDELITRYHSISLDKALINASEVVTITKQVKDTIRVSLLKTPEFRLRLNVLYTESLRLKDMFDIPSIADAEIESQVDKIVLSYDAIQSKINREVYLLSKQEDFDSIDFSF